MENFEFETPAVKTANPDALLTDEDIQVRVLQRSGLLFCSAVLAATAALQRRHARVLCDVCIEVLTCCVPAG